MTYNRIAIMGSFKSGMLAASLLLLGCEAQNTALHGASGQRIPSVSETRAAEYDATFPKMLEKHGVITAGVGIIKGGELVWTGYYGEQSPGVRASADTQFDVASITKTVAAETLLRLAEQGRIDLDESMAAYWLEDDIAEDPHASSMTPRMALIHSIGFPNWRFLN